MALSVQEMQYSCDSCEYNCKGLAKLMAHLMMAHPGVRFVQCESCGIVFHSAQMLEEHEKTHENGPYKCDSCGQFFDREDHAKDHFGCPSRSRKRFGCDLCDFGCNSPLRYKAHMLLHRMEMGVGSDDSDSGGVDEAGDSHPAAGEVEVHQEASARLEQYRCDFCDDTFVHSSQLKTHMKTHSNGRKPASELGASDVDASKPHHSVGGCWFTVDHEVDLNTNTAEKPLRGDPGARTKAVKPASDTGASDPADLGDDIGGSLSDDDEELDLETLIAEMPHRDDSGTTIAHMDATKPGSNSGASDATAADVPDDYCAAVDDEEVDLGTHIESNSGGLGTLVAYSTAMKPSSDSCASGPADSGDDVGDFWTTIVDEGEDLNIHVNENLPSGQPGPTISHTKTTSPSSDLGSLDGADSCGDGGASVVDVEEDLETRVEESTSDSGATVAHPKVTIPASNMAALAAADSGGGWTSVVEEKFIEVELKIHVRKKPPRGSSGPTVARKEATKPTCVVSSDKSGSDSGETRRRAPSASNSSSFGVVKLQRQTLMKVKPFKSDLGGDKAPSISEKVKQSVPRLFKCGLCQFSSVECRLLEVHMRTRHVERPSECKICDSWFPNDTMLKAHEKTHAQEKDLECGSGNLDSANFNSGHFGGVSQTPLTVEGAHTCDLCGYTCDLARQLKAHKRTHATEKEPVCDSGNLDSANFGDTSGDVDRTTDAGDEGAQICDLCGYSCDLASQLKAHMMTHSVNEKPEDNDSLAHTSKSTKHRKSHQCDECDRSFVHFGHWAAHARTHTGEKPFKCNECDARFSTKSHLNSHTRIHTGEKPHKCSFCDRSFRYSQGLNVHVRTHTGEKPFKCNECDTKFSTKSGLNSHMLIHTGEKPHKCSFCDRSFRISQHLKEHLRTHTGERPYICDECGKSFAQNSNWRMHKKMHAGLKTIKCDFCSYATYSRNQLKIHLRSHSEEKPYVCDICRFACKTKSVLNLHQRTHTGERPFQCDRCGYACAQAGYMRIHMRSHTGEKPYKCDLCQYTTSRKECLTVHKRTHTGEKPYKCDICGHECASSGHMASHRRTHTGEKPYACWVCGRRFNQSNQLKSHLRTHTEKKPYKCDTCDYVCSTAGSLKVHKRTHTGDKPFKCDTCSASFTTTGRLKSHVKAHSKKKKKSEFDSDHSESDSRDTDSSYSDSGDSDSGNSSDD